MEPKSRVQQHLQRLCVEIGSRPAGSSANHAAAEYIAGVLAGYGLEVERQDYACTVWQPETVCLSSGGQRYEAWANPYTPACDLEAPLLVLDSLAMVETTPIRGQVCLLVGDLVRTALSPKAWMFKSEEDARLVELLEAGQPAALVTVQTQPGSTERLVEDDEFTVPSVTVPAGVGLQLLQRAGQPVALKITCQRSVGTSANVVALRKGERPERVVFCAHYDTKMDTPGALDNAAGVAALLATAEALSQQDLKIGLEWIAFSGEESLPLGDDTYVALREGQFEQMLLVINFDGLGQALQRDTFMVNGAAEAFQAALIDVAQGYPTLAQTEPWIESNHSTFVFRGVPAVAFCSRRALMMAHQRFDTLEWLDAQKIVTAAQAAAEMAQRAANFTSDAARLPVSEMETK